jgi:formate/nitrite transporter
MQTVTSNGSQNSTGAALEAMAKIDAYAPAEIALRVEEVGVKKAHLNVPSLFALAVLAGAFIGLGADFYTAVITGSTAGFGLTRLIGAVAFCLGLILVVVAGAELFTGNNLIMMAWASGKVTTLQLLHNWTVVYLGNLVGAVATAALVFYSGQWKMGGNAVGETALTVAVSKINMTFTEALARGILCNALVCLAVWLCFSARSTTDKILAILFPIAAFVTCGFEHSIANMFFVPLGLMLKGNVAGVDANALTWHTFIVNNLLPVTIGNVIGGGLMVGAVYWFIYLRPKD